MSYLPLSNLGILTNQNYLKNPDAESSTSGFNVGSVTLSSGIPTGAPTIGSVTGFSLTRDTTNRLVGGASFEITAGSGGTTPAGAAIISDIITINDIDLAKVLSFGFGYKLVTDGANLDFSGSATQSMELWVYNIGLAQWIQPQGYRGINTKNAVGKVTATFQSDALNTSNRNQYRLAIIFKNSISSLTEFVFDQAFLNNSPTLFGAAVTDWQAYTPTFGAGFGTPTSVAMYYRRVGDSVEVVGSFNTGTVTANLASISLPTGLSIDTAKISLQNTTASSGMQVGQSQQSVTGGAQTLRAIVTATGTNASLVYVGNILYYTAPSRPGELVPSTTGLDYGASPTSVSFKVPVADWSSNVSMAESSTFSISSYLANGTRVTTTPTKLGEYRARRHAINTVITDGPDDTPSPLPSTTNGISIIAAAYNAAGSSGQIARYDIFIGKNKNFRMLVWASSGGLRTGPLNYEIEILASDTVMFGFAPMYDPDTGVLTVDAGYNYSSSTTTRFAGRDINGTNITTALFDIIVSENALQVGVQEPRSEVKFSGSAGSAQNQWQGTVNTTVARFTTSSTMGTAITYVSSSTLGDTFIINEDGVYSGVVTAYNAAASGFGIGFTLNSAQLTTEVNDVATQNKLVDSYYGSNSSIIPAAFTRYLPAGSVIRVQGRNTTIATTPEIYGSITKVSN